MNLIQLSLYYYSSSIIAACNDQLFYDQPPCAPILNSWSSLTTSLLLQLQSLQYSSTAPSRIAASSRGYWFASAFTAPPSSIIHHAGSNNKLLHFKYHQSQRATRRIVRLFEKEDVDNSQLDTMQQQKPLDNEEEEEEREKLNYLALAKEAHSKFFVDQISQEEYVNLALSAWNDAYSSNDDADADNGSADWNWNEDSGSNNAKNQSQSSSPAILKGASSSSSSSVMTNDYYYSAATTTNVNKLQSNQSSGVGDVSKLKSTTPFVVGKKGNDSSSGNKLGQASSFATMKTKQLQQQPLMMVRDNSQFAAVQQQQQQQKFGATAAFGKNKFSSSKISSSSSSSNDKGGGTKSSSPMSLQNNAQPSSSSLDPSSIPIMDKESSLKSNVLKQPTPLTQPASLKGVSKRAAGKGGGEFNSAFSKVPSSTSMPLSPSSSLPPLKGSSPKSLFSKESSSLPPSRKDNNSSSSNSSSNNGSNPFELFGGLGAKLFGKSKRPTPSTSLIGGMGMLNEVEQSDVPYGLRVGKKKAGGNAGGDVVGATNSDNGGGVDRVVGKGSMPSPGVMSKEKQQVMMKQEKLKGATSFGGTANISSSSSSTVGQTTKKVAVKGGEFQPSLTQKAINTPTNPATFQKGTLGNKIGKGVLPTKKTSTPIKKMSTFVNKAPLQQQPQPISNEANAVQSPSSSVLKSIDKNKEEIAQTKSWIENEKRLDDVRKKVAEIQGGTMPPTSVGGGGGDRNPPFQFVAETATEDFSEVEEGAVDEATAVEANPAAANTVPKTVEEEPVSAEAAASIGYGIEKEEEDASNESVEDWIQEQNRIARERAAARMAAQDPNPKKMEEEPLVAAAAAIGNLIDKEEEDATNESPEDWIEEQNRIAQERNAARTEQEKRAQEEAVAVAAAMAEEEIMLKAREEAEAKAQNDRLNEAMKQSNMEKPRSEQIPNGEYWLAEQNRVVEERQQASVSKGSAGVQLKGSDRVFGSEQPIVQPAKIPTQKRVEVANTVKGMPLKAGSLTENKSPIRPQQPLKIGSPNVDPAVSSMPRIAKEGAGNQLKGSDRAIRSDQPIVQPKNMPTPKRVEDANTVKGMPLKTEPLTGNKSPFPIRPDMQQQPLKIGSLTVDPAVSSMPRIAKEGAGKQLKGSDRAIRSDQPIVQPKNMPTPKRVEVANTVKGMPLKTEPLTGNKSPFPIRPDMQQQSLKIGSPNVEPAASSPLSDGPKIPTTLRGSSEVRMIEKGFVPFTGPTSTQGGDVPNVPVNVQQVVAPMIPINKIEPSVASQMIAPTMQKKENESRSLDMAEAEAWAGSLDDIDFSSLPVIRVGNRICSSFYGTTHQVLLILPKEDGEFEILPCVAKRPWTMAELYANVPSKVSAFEEQQSESAFDELIPPEGWEVDYNAKSVRRYWEVEIHCNKKFQQKKELYERLQIQALNDNKQDEDGGAGESDGADDGVSFAVRVAEVAIPKFYDVYPDDGSGGTNEDDIIPEYGFFGQDVWNKTIELGHDWLVYESKLEVNELTLLDAMTMQHEINKQFLEDGYQVHHLYGIQQAMKLPDAFGFGDVMDVIILNPSNIICDEDNGRLRIINFGDAVDLDPKETVRVGLDNDTLESNAPGAIANSLAADVFSVALVVCELLFDFDEATFTAQIKEVGYDLDAWLKRTLTADERPLGLDEALWYLSERRGLWALLKSMVKPNPLRRKITSASMQQFNEIIALKDGKIEETDQVLAGGDESFLNSVLFPSGSDNGSSGNANIPSSARKALDASNDDIPQTQYTSTLPRASTSSSVLSELAEQIKDDADEQNQRMREEGPNSNPKMQNPAHTASSSNSDTYNDITRATFTPARASKLTAMLAPKSRDPVAQKQQSLPEQQSGNYYDITRASFERVSPQPMALTASQLYSILRESGAAGIPPQFDYDLTQSGYVPETNIGQSSYRGNNIVLPQRAVSSNISRGYVPARPTESISQEAYEEVEQWLVSRLPRLQRADVSNYCWSLIDDGFDSAEMLEELEFDDLHFMKKAHQRALTKALSQDVNVVPEKAVVDSNDQSPPKKVYKVEEALGEAARKGIEALVAASKADNQQKDDRKQILERFKAYEAKIAAEKAETERKIADVQNRMQAEIRAKAEEERELKEVQERIEAQLQIKAKEEQRLRELEKELEIRDRVEEDMELKELQDRIENELKMKAKEERRLKDLEEEMEQQSKAENPSDANWVEEQNRIAMERNRDRAPARGKEMRQNELKDSTANSEKKSRLANLIDKASELSFEGMTADDAELVRMARLNEPTEQQQNQEREEKINNVTLNNAEDWLAEQNRLVEERRRARLAKERKKE
eukprot:scaffold10964_cov146-Skeletonema_marinoi.AAC.5